MNRVIIYALPLILFACGGSNPPNSSSQSEEVDGQQGAQMLHVAAEIGIELGDSNFVFGVIQDVDFTPEGNIAVLDAQRKRIRMFSPAGDYLGEFGGEGEGPGEFLNPRGIACLSDGTIAVTDPFSREVELFSSDLQYLETISNFAARAPFIISAAGSGFVGEQGGFDREAGVMTTSVALWKENTDSVHVFFEVEDNFSPENMVQRFMLPSAGLIADSNCVYYSAPLSEEYLVSVYPIDGSDHYNLSFPGYTPVRKTEEDTQEDIVAYEYRMQSMASSGRGGRLAAANYEPPSHYFATASMGCDSEGNIWVQRGWEHNPTFDLFPPGATEPNAVVTVDSEPDLSDFTFVITPNGMAAYNLNPDDYPRVLILSF